MATAKDRLSRALYYTYADLRYEPTKDTIPHWWELSDRERVGWEQVAEMTIVLIGAAKTSIRRR